MLNALFDTVHKRLSIERFGVIARVLFTSLSCGIKSSNTQLLKRSEPNTDPILPLYGIWRFLYHCFAWWIHDKRRLGHWLGHHQNLIFTGKTGCGKTYLGCAIERYFCQQGVSVRYYRMKSLQAHLRQVHGDGSYPRFLNQLNNTQILILDDWGMEALSTEQRSDLLDIIDARHEQCSMIIMSQLPVANWHALIGEATYADAIMDRLIHRAQRFELEGESMRKLIKPLTGMS